MRNILLLLLLAIGFTTNAQTKTDETIGGFYVAYYSDGSAVLVSPQATQVRGTSNVQLYFTVFIDENTLLFSLRDGKDESSYSGQTFTVSVILDGDKSTYQTGKGKGFGTASIDINDVIYKYDAVDIKSAKFVYFKVGEWVFKIDFDGFGEAVEKALTFVEGEEEDPFGGVSSDPFDTPKKNITNSVEWTEAYDLTSLNPFELSAYLDVFVKDAAAFGIDLSYVYDGSISFEFKNDPVAGPETIAYTDSLGKDDKVHVVVNPYWWNQASPAKRLAIMYHELGHDILNFDHDSEEGPLMSVYAQSDYTYEDLFALRAQMFNDYLNGVEYGIED